MYLTDEIEEKKTETLKLKPNLGDYASFHKDFSWKDAEKEIEFFEDGKFNAAFNAIDRHCKTENKDKKALIWEGEDKTVKEFSFDDLRKESNKFANLLKKNGIKKGDRVFLFLPRIPEAYISFLGILKTGAIAGTLFQAFGPKALQDRLGDSEAIAVITTNKLKERVYLVKNELPELKQVILVDEENPEKGEISYPNEMKQASPEFEIEHMEREEIAFMLYTSGTTGKPKGVVHAHLAILQEHMTSKWVLDLHPEDIYWCTADPGWVTGVAYTILGPWSNGITSLVFGGRFSPENWYELLQKYKVSVWYTAPTAVRMLMKFGEELPKKYDFSNLRHILSVGEPLNPEAIRWGKQVFGLLFHDTWWQTETGAMMVTNYPSMPIKLGSMGKPVPGVEAAILNEEHSIAPANEEGNLAIKPGWPSMMRGIWKNKARYDKCFEKGWYISGDRALQDKDGYFWFVGRADDVIKTSGERVGPFEVESALVDHEAIAEAGVIGKPDPTRGEIIKAFCILNPGVKGTDELKEEIKKFVKKKLAGHAYPREIDFVEGLPKTKSGKIMRRVLKSRELGKDIGDTSTLEEY